MKSKQKLEKIIDNSMKIGDDFYKKYKKSKTNEDAFITIKAYNTCIRAEIAKKLDYGK